MLFFTYFSTSQLCTYLILIRKIIYTYIHTQIYVYMYMYNNARTYSLFYLLLHAYVSKYSTISTYVYVVWCRRPIIMFVKLSENILFILTLTSLVLIQICLYVYEFGFLLLFWFNVLIRTVKKTYLILIVCLSFV